MWSRLVCYDDHSDRFGRSRIRSAGVIRRRDGHATTMIEDTDHDEREDDQPAVSLPLIDTFAALEAELDAKADRIERLESELDRGYLDPPDGEPVAEDGEGSDATDDPEPRTHEDWEPETDPLDDTGAAAADGDHEGVTPSVESQFANTDASGDGEVTRADRQAPAESEPPADTDESGLAPVRTASAGSGDSDSAATDRDDAAADDAFGVTMEATGNLTGGSLGSTAGGATTTARDDSEETDESAEDGTSPPDPTADRGERLSLLVRRAELRDEDEVVETFVRGIDGLNDVTREMLAHYREAGDAAPVDAHVAAGGSGERQYAYARNRTLRKAGVIEHDGAGRYRYALPDLVAEAFDGNADDGTVADAVDAIEAAAALD